MLTNVNCSHELTCNFSLKERVMCCGSRRENMTSYNPSNTLSRASLVKTSRATLYPQTNTLECPRISPVNKLSFEPLSFVFAHLVQFA